MKRKSTFDFLTGEELSEILKVSKEIDKWYNQQRRLLDKERERRFLKESERIKREAKGRLQDHNNTIVRGGDEIARILGVCKTIFFRDYKAEMLERGIIRMWCRHLEGKVGEIEKFADEIMFRKDGI